MLHLLLSINHGHICVFDLIVCGEPIEPNVDPEIMSIKNHPWIVSIGKMLNHKHFSWTHLCSGSVITSK